METERDECVQSSGEAVAEREEPLGSVNGKAETDDKENSNGVSADEPQAVRYEHRTRVNRPCGEIHVIVPLKDMTSF